MDRLVSLSFLFFFFIGVSLFVSSWFSEKAQEADRVKVRQNEERLNHRAAAGALIIVLGFLVCLLSALMKNA